jgi:hypothetical protein
MTEISSPLRAPPLLSPRTASYIAALIQEGDDFDYSTWLREAKAKERRTKQTIAADLGTSLFVRNTKLSGQHRDQ